MKKILSYSAAALLGIAALSSCGEDFTYPPVILPSVDVEPTVTLEGFKERYWSSLESGPTTIGFLNSEHKDSVIFIGRVCSSDKTGNIYKNVIIQSRDDNGEQIAMTFSVNGYDLYENMPFGQEVAVYATGLQVGGYRGLFQFGAASGNEMTFMDKSLFTEHVIRNHTVIPQPELVDTTLATIPEIIAAKSSAAGLRLWQSRLIRINDVSFVDAGQPYAGSTSTNRNIIDANGNKLIVRNSSYADFAQETLPYGKGSVTGILSYFGSDWQLLLIDTDGVAGFDGTAPEPVQPDEPAGDGTAESPYNVAMMVKNGKNMIDKEVYVKGIITSVQEISTSFGNATYNIADKEGDTNFYIFRGLWLGGAKFTAENQLQAGATVVVKGKVTEYNGTLQLAQGNTIISYDGQTSGGDKPSGDGKPEGDGTAESPFNSVKALETATALAADSPTTVEYYVKGKVSSIKEISTSFGNATYSITSEGTTVAFDIYRGYWLNGEKFTAEDQLKVGDEVTVCGKFVNYKGNTPQMNQGGKIVSINK